MRIELAQYRELESFVQFGSELDRASQQQLDRGGRIVEILKQPQFQPVPVEEQVVTIWAATNGKLDGVPVPDIRRYESELREFMGSRHGDLLDEIRSSGDLGDDLVSRLGRAIDDFGASFRPGEVREAGEHRTSADLDTLSDELDSLESRQDDARREGEQERGPLADTDAPPAP
jgi:F-type H+/Na+-transporting ATPase subunit alpha